MKPISKNKVTLLAAACLIVLHCLIPGREGGSVIPFLLKEDKCSHRKYSDESNWGFTAAILDRFLQETDFHVLPTGPFEISQKYHEANSQSPSGVSDHDEMVSLTIYRLSTIHISGVLYYMPLRAVGTITLNMATQVDIRIIHITGIGWILRTPDDAPDLFIIRLDHLGSCYVGVFQGRDNVFIGKDENDLRTWIGELEVFNP